MYDYVDGKADWMAYGLPVEGDDGPFVGDHVSAAPTCDVGLTVADARRILQEPGAGLVVVLAGDGFVVGEIDAGAVEGHGDDEVLIDVMAPVPSTVRPSVTVASVAAAGGGRRLVTTSDGRLVGAVTVEADEHGHGHGANGHEGHDHGNGDGDDHGDGDVDMERFERELTEVMEGVQERFGDREPTDEELRAFLHERLVAEGRSPEEADRFLDELAE